MVDFRHLEDVCNCVCFDRVASIDPWSISKTTDFLLVQSGRKNTSYSGKLGSRITFPEERLTQARSDCIFGQGANFLLHMGEKKKLETTHGQLLTTFSKSVITDFLISSLPSGWWGYQANYHCSIPAVGNGNLWARPSPKYASTGIQNLRWSAIRRRRGFV